MSAKVIKIFGSREEAYGRCGYIICRERDVDGAQYYLGNGQGCRTIWFKTFEAAERALREAMAQGKPAPSGEDSGLCKRCACHYGVADKNFKKYPMHACRAWKEEFAQKYEEGSN